MKLRIVYVSCIIVMCVMWFHFITAHCVIDIIIIIIIYIIIYSIYRRIQFFVGTKLGSP